MSEIATEIRGADHTITTLEFLGNSFADRLRALKEARLFNRLATFASDDTVIPRHARAFQRMAQTALADKVMSMAGEEVTMTFRPSSLTRREWKAWAPYYSILDTDRRPITRNVTIRGVRDDNMLALVSQGEMQNGTPDVSWSVKLDKIVSIELIPEQASVTE